MLADAVADIESASTSTADFIGSVERRTVGWEIFAGDIVGSQVLVGGTGDDNADTSAVCDSEIIETAETFTCGAAEGKAKSRHVDTGVVDHVLPAVADHGWDDAFTVDDSAGVVLAGEAVAGEGVEGEAVRRDGQAKTEVEVLSCGTGGVEHAPAVNEVVAEDAVGALLGDGVESEAGKTGLSAGV